MFAGIDIGASSTDIVLLDTDANILAHGVLNTKVSHKDTTKEALKMICDEAECLQSDIVNIVGTGYGRKNIDQTRHDATEITCHCKGAHYFFPGVKTILDIGGQDSKVIKTNANGKIVDFVMNEKCAAGTGRFLEAMARILAIPIDKMGELSEKSRKQIKLSSVCTVFAESEVISQISEECQIEDIINGIHDSVSVRAAALLQRAGIENDIVMTGGVAKNAGVVRLIEKYIENEILIPPEPQIIGALGAALIALNEYKKGN